MIVSVSYTDLLPYVDGGRFHKKSRALMSKPVTP